MSPEERGARRMKARVEHLYPILLGLLGAVGWFVLPVVTR